MSGLVATNHPLHDFFLLLADSTSLLHDQDMGIDIGEEMQEKIPTSGIRLLLLGCCISITLRIKWLTRVGQEVACCTEGQAENWLSGHLSARQSSGHGQFVNLQETQDRQDSASAQSSHSNWGLLWMYLGVRGR